MGLLLGLALGLPLLAATGNPVASVVLGASTGVTLGAALEARLRSGVPFTPRQVLAVVLLSLLVVAASVAVLLTASP